MLEEKRPWMVIFAVPDFHLLLSCLCKVSLTPFHLRAEYILSLCLPLSYSYSIALSTVLRYEKLMALFEAEILFCKM